MNRNRRLRIGRTPAVGALVAAGVVGAALLAGPLASSQASSQELFPRGITYHNGGFCYQNPAGEANTYRLYFSESSYDRNSTGANLTFMVQKWDGSSNQYQDERVAFTTSADKAGLASQDEGAWYADPNFFCKSFSEGKADQLGGDVYRYGQYTSTRTVEPGP